MKAELINIRPDARKESNGCNGTLEREEWRPVKGYEGLYEVSSFGRVKALRRIIVQSRGTIMPYPEKILKLYYNIDGYHQVVLSKQGQTKRLTVHRLVAQAFILNPDNLPCVNHRNEVRDCNIPDNLEWCTVKYNNNYGTCIERRSKKRIGLKHSEDSIRKMCISHRRHTKDILQIDKTTGEILKEWECANEITKTLGISGNAIAKCCKKYPHYNTAGGYIWKYKSDYENEQRQ